MTFPSLQPLADRAALFVALRQDALSAELSALGEHRWDADLEAATIVFSAEGDPGRRLTAGINVVATLAPGPSSLLWDWAHPQGNPAGLSTQLRDYGVEHGIAELTTAEIPFPADAATDSSWITQAAHTIGAVAVEVTGRSPYFVAPVGGGTYAVLLLDAPLPPLTVATATTAAPRVLSALALPDARSAVWDTARLAGWNLDWADASFSAAIVSDRTATATFTFDEQARITNISGSLAPQG